MPRGFDAARVALIVTLFAGVVVLRALHDIPITDFRYTLSTLIGAVLGAGSQAARPARASDRVTT